MPQIRFLSSDDVARALPMVDAIEAMREAFVALSAGEAAVPERAGITIAGGDALFMPAYVPSLESFGLKVINVYGANPARGLPRIHALVTLFDAATGMPTAVMDGSRLTALRTGAASGLATSLLAREDARVAALFGAGVQAHTQLEAVCTVRRIRQARIFDLAGERAAALAEYAGRVLGLETVIARTPAEALAGADVVCCAATAGDPLFEDRHVAAGTHINAIGAYKPDVREVPGETVCRARVVVDYRPAALAEAGDLLIPMAEGRFRAEQIHAELGEIAAGHRTGRQSPEEVTLFKSVGVAVQDVAAAAQALRNAQQLGLGTLLAL